MTAAEYRSTLARLGLSQARLGRILRADKSTPNRWATGASDVPRAVAILLRLLDAGAATVDQIEAL